MGSGATSQYQERCRFKVGDRVEFRQFTDIGPWRCGKLISMEPLNVYSDDSDSIDECGELRKAVTETTDFSYAYVQHQMDPLREYLQKIKRFTCTPDEVWDANLSIKTNEGQSVQASSFSFNKCDFPIHVVCCATHRINKGDRLIYVGNDNREGLKGIAQSDCVQGTVAIQFVNGTVSHVCMHRVMLLYEKANTREVQAALEGTQSLSSQAPQTRGRTHRTERLPILQQVEDFERQLKDIKEAIQKTERDLLSQTVAPGRARDILAQLEAELNKLQCEADSMNISELQSRKEEVRHWRKALIQQIEEMHTHMEGIFKQIHEQSSSTQLSESASAPHLPSMGRKLSIKSQLMLQQVEDFEHQLNDIKAAVQNVEDILSQAEHDARHVDFNATSRSLTNEAPERDAQPLAGINAALASAFNYRGSQGGVFCAVAHNRARDELAQIEAQLNKLQFNGMDSINVSDLQSGKEEVRALRKAFTQRAEDLHARIEGLFKRIQDYSH